MQCPTPVNSIVNMMLMNCIKQEAIFLTETGKAHGFNINLQQ